MRSSRNRDFSQEGFIQMTSQSDTWIIYHKMCPGPDSVKEHTVREFLHLRLLNVFACLKRGVT